LERLAKVILYGTLATIVPFYNTVFLHFAIAIKNNKQIHNFRKAQRAECKASKSRSLATPALYEWYKTCAKHI